MPQTSVFGTSLGLSARRIVSQLRSRISSIAAPSAPGRGGTCPGTFEKLESRVLMSVVNISPGANVQNAITSSHPGDTVQFAPGNYNFGGTVKLLAGRTYQGNNSTLNGNANNGSIFTTDQHASGITVQGFTFNGAGLKLDASSSNLTVRNNTFQNITTGNSYTGNGLYIPGGVSNTTIANNSFKNISGLGIYFINGNSTLISHNSFDQVNEAMKIDFFNNGSGVTVDGNNITHATRFGIEIQSACRNLTVSNNSVTQFNSRSSHIALSIATGGSQNTRILNNTLTGDPSFYANTNYAAIEAMGNGLQISGNTITNWGWGELVGFSSNWSSTNNTFRNVWQVFQAEAGGNRPSVSSDHKI